MGQHPGIAERESPNLFIAEPAGAPGAPRVVIAPEIFGLTPWITSGARRLAREGLRAVAPEIFAGAEPIGPDRASWMQRIRNLDVPQTVRLLRSSLGAIAGPGAAASIGFRPGRAPRAPAP